jgi:hypothetical protein
VCGAQLTDVNQRICQLLPLLTGAFASLNEYINIIVEGTCICVRAIYNTAMKVGDLVVHFTNSHIFEELSLNVHSENIA